MGRLIRISIYALIILILYFWATAIIKSYQKDKVATDVVETDQGMVSDSMAIDTIALDTALSLDESEEMISHEDIVDGKIDYEALDNKVKKLEENKKPAIKPAEVSHEAVQKPKVDKPKVQPKENISSTDKGGPYKVMAGSYLLKENAQKMVNKLKGMGYNSTEIVVFKASGYHSVIAVRYDSESKAKSASGELKRNGIESFVKR